MWRFFKNMIQLIISPDNGWEDVMRSSNPLKARYMMGWFIVIAALAGGISLLYPVHPPLLVLCQRAIAIFVVSWATVFFADFVITLALPRLDEGVMDPRNVSIMISYTVSLLAIQQLLSALIPMTFAMLELWPVYVVVILWRAMKSLELEPGVTGKYLLTVIIAFILPSQLLMRVFNYFVQ